MHPSGLRDETAAFFGRNLFGTLEGASGSGSSTNAETGFTGASTPNQTGGFTYLRNRWYDPQSGRFLTQDPIGLAGGVNLYAYAGNNPVSFSDPFGLCPQLWRAECWSKSSSWTMGDYVVGGSYLAAGLSGAIRGARARSILGTMWQVRGEAASLVGDRLAADKTKWEGPRGNAFRHIFGACQLTRKLGRATATKITNAHETTVRSGNEKQEKDSNADLENNAIGMSAAEAEGNANASCEAIADGAIDSGNYSTGE